MSTNTYKTFAIAGATGGSDLHWRSIGNEIVRAFLQRGFTPKVLTRSSSADSKAAQELRKAGAEIVAIDYENKASLVRALTGIDVLVSAVGAAGIPHQQGLAEAAKDAGVKLFVPSDFGSDSVQAKKDIREYARSISLPITVILTGGFVEYNAFFARVDEHNQINIIGDGKQPVSFTKIKDIAEYLAYVLSSLPKDEVSDITLAIEGSRHTLNEIANARKAKDPSISFKYHSIESAERKWKEDHDFLSLILSSWAKGEGLTTGKGGVQYKLANSLYPDWHPTDVLDAI